jgi:protein-tyrosine phosphatase
MDPMVDIHAHLLPNLDDGPDDMDAALAMCEAYVAQGVGTVVATPHMADGAYNITPDETRLGVERLNEACAEADIDLRVLPGGEVRVAAGLFEMIEAGEVLTLGDAGTHVLLELGPGPTPPLERLIEELLRQGVTPVLGHPERHPEFWRRPGPLTDWARMGCLYQVTAASLTGRLGRRPRRLAQAMVEAGMVHAVASDAHSSRGKRRSVMDRAYRGLSRVAGRRVAQHLMAEAPGTMIGVQAAGTPGQNQQLQNSR